MGKITVRSKKLEPAGLGAFAWKGIHPDARVKCPAGMADLYDKYFRKMGLPQTAIVK